MSKLKELAERITSGKITASDMTELRDILEAEKKFAEEAKAAEEQKDTLKQAFPTTDKKPYKKGGGL